MIAPDELRKLHYQRAKHILSIAASNKADVVVLGAFGCGAFANDPRIVADAIFKAVGEYKNIFDEIEFAVFCRSYETENYDIFLDTYLKYMAQK